MNFKKYDDHIELDINDKSIIIIANKDVDIQKNSLEQLEHLDSNLSKLNTPENPGTFQYIGTPDFHKGDTIPIGTTVVSNYFIPKLMGNDISCGMQLTATNLIRNKLTPSAIERLVGLNRHDYFEGGRGVKTNATLRKDIVEKGIHALRNIDISLKKDTECIWNVLNKIKLPEQKNTCTRSSIRDTNIFDDWIEESKDYDSQLGSIGGGNHFCEYLYTDKILDSQISRQLNITPEQVVILVHSGSLGFGHGVNMVTEDALKSYWKSKGGKLPPILGLPPSEKDIISRLYKNIKNAANFAQVNRTVLSAIAFRNLERATSNNLTGNLITDIDHNMIDRYEGNFRHRKGACSAKENELVLIPGSMGTSSYLCIGTGNRATLQVSSHGSGRSYSRGEAMKKDKKEFDNWRSSYHIVTQLDFDKVTNNVTKQLKIQQLMQESPLAYKDIEPTVDSQVAYDMILPVARMKSILTIKAL